VTIDQQQQARDYFNAVSREWQDKARGAAVKVNIIRQRNEAVLREAARRTAPGRAADLGCGSGELVIALAQRGWEAIGVDFAPEMIERCRESARTAGVNAEFVAGSMFDWAPADGWLDIVSGQGLIEYISPAQLETLLGRIHRMLKRGGSAVLGSRNRLFNLVSLSDYTAMERDLDTVAALLAEALALAQAGSMAEAIAAARTAAEDLAHPKTHPRTVVGVDTRYQYTPGQLVRLLERAGFRATMLSPVHVHAMPVPAAGALPQTHIALSEFLFTQHPEEARIIPYASSFVLAAEKA
jgi:2-polyprenyl-3-methyl-5-hydroxy-6-metoxy-1,4-benzoquinol methylase